MPISVPAQITVPFATSGLKNAIPANANNTTGNAGFDLGFPSINMTPTTGGGIPPFGQDFNGIFFNITTAIQYFQAGGSFPFSSAFSTAVGGYPNGAIVSRTDNTGLWRNTTANNTTDPEAGGAGWQPEDAGSSTITMSSSNVTLTSLQAAKTIIFLTGTLTTNLQLIFPTYVKQWLVINNCAGAFTVTAKTAAGSGVAIATGVSQGVFGDGANISQYIVQAPGGRLLRTSVYQNSAGTLQVSVNGGAFVTASSTFTAISGAVSWDVEVVGSGGSGGGAAITGSGQVAAGSGGGAGGYARGIFTSGISGASIFVGQGRSGVTAGAGVVGQASGIGGVISGLGGSGGTLGAAQASNNQFAGQAAGGAGTGGYIQSQGGAGSPAFLGSNPTSGAGGASIFGAGGAQVSGTSVGSVGANYGSGGSGGSVAPLVSTGAGGGSSASGLVIIRDYS